MALLAAALVFLGPMAMVLRDSVTVAMGPAMEQATTLILWGLTSKKLRSSITDILFGIGGS
jgi:hypothetical protein